jgi:transcriptional regulator with XRE-family HTH domain
MRINEHFCRCIMAGMRARGLTLRGLCRAAGVDPSFFSKVLAGRRSPPSDEAMLRRIAEVLEIDAAELIVSAGRIPAEWRAIQEDPGLFRDIHARVTRAVNTLPGRSVHPTTTGNFSEELL